MYLIEKRGFERYLPDHNVLQWVISARKPNCENISRFRGDSQQPVQMG